MKYHDFNQQTGQLTFLAGSDRFVIPLRTDPFVRTLKPFPENVA